MKLYYFETPNARKVCAVARHLALPVEFVRVNIAENAQKDPDFLAVNPNGKIPALEDGPYTLWESPAIMCYLAHKAGSDLWPQDSLQQIDIVRWINWDTAHFSRHAGQLFFESYVKPVFGIGEANPAKIEEASGFFKQFAGVLNTHLEGRDYLVGDRLTVADFSVAAFLPWAKETKLPLEEFGEIQRWHANLMELPAWREPFPEQQAAA